MVTSYDSFYIPMFQIQKPKERIIVRGVKTHFQTLISTVQLLKQVKLKELVFILTSLLPGKVLLFACLATLKIQVSSGHCFLHGSERNMFLAF